METNTIEETGATKVKENNSIKTNLSNFTIRLEIRGLKFEDSI